MSRQLDLEKEMALAGIRPEDILESFIRAKGPGGQNVNKTSTCVYLKHIPTAIEVKCQKERSQAENRYLARRILLNKIKAAREKQINKEKEALARFARQKRRRPKQLKLKILEAKRRHSQKKQLRRRMSLDSE